MFPLTMQGLMEKSGYILCKTYICKEDQFLLRNNNGIDPTRGHNSSKHLRTQCRSIKMYKAYIDGHKGRDKH